VKILHVIGNISPRFGGPSIVCKEICHELSEAGQEVVVYTTNADYPHGTLDVPVNKPVSQGKYLIYYFSIQFEPYLFSLNLLANLFRHIKEYDIVHIHGLYRFPQTIAGYLARLYEIPYIIRPHGSLDPLLYNQKRHFLTKRIHEILAEFPNLNQASIIHCTNKKEKESMRQLNLKTSGIVIPNGIEISLFNTLPSKGTFREKYNLGKKKLILHLGRIHFVKGLDILIKAFAKLSKRNDNLHLILAGPDNDGYGEILRSLILREGVENSITFTGMLKGMEKLSALNDADIFVLPSYSESFGVAIVEAMACYLPVVISNRVNICREIQDAGAGIVTSCDADEIAKAIESLLDDVSIRFHMGMRGRALAREQYAWPRIVKQLVHVYSELIETKSLKRRNPRK
jgi:glycosyltransferase involved in cell wall biosynthesis